MLSNQVKIKTIYDNIEFNSKFNTDWGYACIVEHPQGKILFDTGAKPEILKANLETAKISPQSIASIVISHNHFDHTGGISWILQNNSHVQILIPRTFFNKLGKKLSKKSSNIISISKNTTLPGNSNFHLIITKNFWITELSLVIGTHNGAIVITGCSHTGIHKIAQKAYKQTGLKVYALFGGFHLFRSSIPQIKQITNSLKELHITKVAPCHCTGENAMNELKKEFADNFIKNGVGAEFTFEI